MSTGGLTSYLFQEDEEKVSFDTQDVQRLESFIGRIENDLKKRGGASFNGGDGDTFLSDDDEWIMDATEITTVDFSLRQHVHILLYVQKNETKHWFRF